MRTFVFAWYVPGDDILQEIVEAGSEFEAVRIFVSDNDYMSYHDAGKFNHPDEILDEVYDTHDVYISYIELE